MCESVCVSSGEAEVDRERMRSLGGGGKRGGNGMWNQRGTRKS